MEHTESRTTGVSRTLIDLLARDTCGTEVRALAWAIDIVRLFLFWQTPEFAGWFPIQISYSACDWFSWNATCDPLCNNGWTMFQLQSRSDFPVTLVPLGLFLQMARLNLPPKTQQQSVEP